MRRKQVVPAPAVELKRRYDAVAAGLFVHVVAFGVVAWVLQGFASLAAGFTGDGEPELLWMRVAEAAGTSPVMVRIAVFGVLQGLLLALGWGPLGVLRRGLTAGLDRLPRGRAGAAWGIAGTLVLTALWVPFVAQPTLVPLTMSGDAWTERAANLLDGRASGAIVASVAGTWRRATGQPVRGRFSVTEVGGGLDAPVMTRWDALLRAATRSREHYAQTRAFLYVESAGRQYAVSRTGCAGLMQFCVSTAQRRPFEGIFGVGAVSACDCGGRPCAVPPDVQRSLETDAEAIVRHRGVFPCDPSDARFDPERAIRAGAAFTAELADAFGDNLELMYIGYNSGPAVSRRLWAALGQDGSASLERIRPLLAPTLGRWYGSNAPGRAQGLADVHLPKLRRAYEASYQAAPAR